MPVAEPEARPRALVRRGSEAVVERAGAAVKSSDKWRVTLRQAQGRLSDEQGAATSTHRRHQTTNVNASRPKAAVSDGWASDCAIQWRLFKMPD